MALKQSALNEIPQRNKDLAFGYITGCEKQTKSLIPEMIKYLCLLYFNQNTDKFDSKHTHQVLTVTIDGKSISNTKCEYDYFNSYLENIVNHGINIWRVKCNYVSRNDMIGIRKMNCCPLKLVGWFDESEKLTDCDSGSSLGYGMFIGGGLTNPDNCFVNGRDDYAKSCEPSDIIEMKLDCNKYTLSYKINNNEYGKAFDIDSSVKYRAAITLSSVFSSYTLVSYQNIY